MNQIDQIRAYWDERPCNIRHSDLPPSDRSHASQVARRRYSVEPHIAEFAQFKKWYGLRVLDLGCGIGADAMRFAMAGASVVGADMSKHSLKIAAASWKSGSFSTEWHRLSFRLSKSDTDMPTGPFDLCWAFGSIHHSPDPKAVLIALRQQDAPRELRMMVYHSFSTKAFRLTRGRFWRNDLIARGSEAQPGCPVTFAYTKRQARRLLKSAGWRVTDIKIRHVFRYQYEAYGRGELRETWLYRIAPKWAWRILDRTLGWHLLITAHPKI